MLATIENKFLEMFRASPDGQKLLDQAEEKRLQQRARAAQEIKRIDAEADAAKPATRKALAAAQKVEHDSAIAFRDAQFALRAATIRHEAIDYGREPAKRPHRELLQQTADPRIDETKREIRDTYTRPIRFDHLTREERELLNQQRKRQLEAIQGGGELDRLIEESLTTAMLTTRLREIRIACGLDGHHALLNGNANANGQN